MNKERIRALLPDMPWAQVVKLIIAIPFIFVGFVIGSVWSGLRAGFTVGRII